MCAPQCACHFSLSPPSLTSYFSLPSAFGYSSNRFPLSQTANDDNEKDYHINDNNNCCNISLGYLATHLHYTAVPGGAAFAQILVSLRLLLLRGSVRLGA